MPAPKASTLKKKIKAGKKLGSTEKASAKARGLIKRADGSKRKSKKYVAKGGALVGKQAKLDVAAPYGKITGADFAVLRKRKPE